MANANCDPCEGQGRLSENIQKIAIACDLRQDAGLEYEIAGCSPDDGLPILAQIDTTTNPPTIVLYSLDGTLYTGSLPLEACDTTITTTQTDCVAIADGVGYSTGDSVTRIYFFDANTVPPTLIDTVWINNETGLIIPSATIDINDFNCGDNDTEYGPIMVCDYSNFTGGIVGRAWIETIFGADGTVESEQLVGVDYETDPTIIQRPYVVQGQLEDCGCKETIHDFCGLQQDQETFDFTVTSPDTVEITQALIELDIATYMFVDWGDGTTDEIINLNIIGFTHVYTVPGVYTISFVASNDGTKISRSIDIDTNVNGVVQFSEINANEYEYQRIITCNGITRWLLVYRAQFVGGPDSFYRCDTLNETFISTEVGCLADAAVADLASANRCAVQEVVINGESFTIDLGEGWTVSELVDAINAIEPGTVELQGGSLIALPGTTIGNLEIICVEEDFLETFGTRVGPLDILNADPVGQPPMDNPGAVTTYNFAINGIGGGPNSYGIHRVADMSAGSVPQNTVFTMGQGAAAVDSQGDPDGLVLGVDGSTTPGTMYQQLATGLLIGKEYQMRVFYADANNPTDNSPVPIPNTPTAQIALRIFDATNTTLIAENDVGFITPKGVWLNSSVRFVASDTSVTFRADNASPVLFGNDLYIDHISFSRLSRQNFPFIQRGDQVPVEIVKVINGEGRIEQLTVYSPDGETIYSLPDPYGRILSTGECRSAASDAQGYDIEQICMEDDNQKFIRHTIYNVESGQVQITEDTELDMVTPYNSVGEVSLCIIESDILTTGYIQKCNSFDITLPINLEATFSDNTGIDSTITGSQTFLTLVNDALLDAQEYENAQVNNSLPVTNFIINTTSNGVYEFPPSAYQGIDNGSLTFTTADLITWPIDGLDTIPNIQYSKFDGCVCDAIEMLQTIDTTTKEITLLAIYEPENHDINGVKNKIDLPLDFGITGPFAGPCPANEQVLELNPLCCDDNLLVNNPDIANQRLAWLDGADISLMTPQGGTIGNAVDGDLIVQVDDKLSSGTNFVIPAPIPTGDDGVTPPFLRENQVNGLSILEFISTGGGTAGSRMRLDTGNTPGADFTLFYLFSATISGVGNQALVSVGPNNTDGDSYFPEVGSWQLSRGSLTDFFVWRSQVSDTDAAPTILFQNTVGTGDGLNPPSGGSASFDATIVPLGQAYDGSLHLLSLNYDSINNILTVFFDGQMQLQLDYTTAPDGANNLGSDYFRIFGNRAGDSFSDGMIAELFYSDSLLNDDEVSIVNAYLICKWGIDPSLAAGGAGDLTLAPPGTYSSPTPLVQILFASGQIVYRNTDTGLEFPVPPVPGLSICAGDGVLGFDAENKCLCDDNGTFVRHVIYDTETGAVSSTFDTELDMVTPYNTVGTVDECSSGGTSTQRNVQPRYTVLGGPATWTMGTNVRAVNVKVIAETPAGTPSTLQTAEGTFDLFPGQSEPFGTDSLDTPLQQPLVVTVTGPNDRVVISWIEEI